MTPDTSGTKTRICPICEAGCGLRIRTTDRQVIAIEPNREDVFSTGHVCAKGIALKELDADPDRLRTPLIRRANGLQPATWNEAFALIESKLSQIRQAHGTSAIGTYIGNPTAHNIGLSMGLGVFASTLGSTQVYSAGSVDQLPKQLACELMFGNDMAIPVPDIERCDYLLMLGANPVVSNGSLWMVPKFRDKLRALHDRGGKLVILDPRLTETARLADQHYAIKPGADAWLLSAVINELRRLGAQIPNHYNAQGAESLFASLAQISSEAAALRSGIDIADIHAIAGALHTAKRAAVYGRVGTTLQQFGTLTSFLIEVINLLTGNLDRAGGAMFPEQAFATPTHSGSGLNYNRYQSRVSGYPEVLGQMPVVALSEEITTPGDGQLRALVCFAGNPVVSNPDSDRLAAALTKLEFMVCIDIYHTETSRYADVILPGTSPFEDSHYDSFLGAMGYKNTARYSPPIFPASSPSEWQMGLTLAYLIKQAAVPTPQALNAFEDDVVAAAVSRHVNDEQGPLFGRDVQEIIAAIGPDRGAERLLDLGIRAGRWGDHFGARNGLTLQQLIDNPNGIDMGALRPNRLNEVVRLKHSSINLAPQEILLEIGRLLAQPVTSGFQLIGRRNSQTNNSWLRNLPMLTKGRALSELEMNLEDARLLGVASGEWVQISTTTATVNVVVRTSNAIRRGTVSLPHGFSEDNELQQHRLTPGANYNRLVATSQIDGLSATAALNGLSVNISRASAAAPSRQH